MGVVNKYSITVSDENYDKYEKEIVYKNETFVKHATVNKAEGTFDLNPNKIRRVEWKDCTVDYLKTEIVPIPVYPGEKQRFNYKFDFCMDEDETLRNESGIKLIGDNFIEEFYDFNKKYNFQEYASYLTEAEIETLSSILDYITMINGKQINDDRYFFLLYPVIQEKLDYDREIDA